MKFPIHYFLIIGILGIILVFSYYYYAVNTPNVLRLWGKIKSPFLYIYYISIFISSLLFLLLLFYLAISKNLEKNDINKLFITICSIIFFSLFWMPFSIEYLKNHDNFIKLLVYLVLFLVSLSSFYLLIILNNINDNQNIILKNIALYGMIYFFIHVFILDFIIWSYNFF